ncbi:MAG: aspartate carbamoyltransferase regulatory subunit [Oscillospiraceae bacterium]
MLNVDSIKNGIVIDHIEAGKSVEIVNYLQLDKTNYSTAIIKNAKSNKMGKKDIIKIEEYIDVNFDILGFIDSNISISIIKDNKIIEKKKLKLPNDIEDVIKCKNPRCITSIEQELKHIFKLDVTSDPAYRCIYCEHESSLY